MPTPEAAIRLTVSATTTTANNDKEIEDRGARLEQAQTVAINILAPTTIKIPASAAMGTQAMILPEPETQQAPAPFDDPRTSRARAA